MRIGLLGSTVMAVSFCGAAAVSWFTRFESEVPSSGLDSTYVGVITLDAGAAVSRLSSSMNAEKRICRPAVPFTEATLPARVLMSYVFDQDGAVHNSATAPSAAQGCIRLRFIGISPLVFLTPRRLRTGSPAYANC